MSPWIRFARGLLLAAVACLCAAAILAGLSGSPLVCIVEAFLAIALAAATRRLTGPAKDGGASAPTDRNHHR